MLRVIALVCCLVFPALAIGCGSGDGSAVPPDGVVVVATVAGGGDGAADATARPAASNSASLEGRPRTGRWIDVDVTRYQVQLMDGETVVQTIGPVAVGEQIDTGVYESTQTGLFHVYVKMEPLSYDAPYDTYISHWVGFDIDKANGFHSFLKDETGKVVDPGTGRISNGCIRTGAAEAIYAFAEIGMPVFVHT